MENRRHFLGKIALAGSVFSPLPVRTAEPERAAAQLLAFDYIETFYDRRRRHSSLGYRSPLAFEKQMFPPNKNH